MAMGTSISSTVWRLLPWATRVKFRPDSPHHKAVAAQLKEGVIFSLPHPIEMEVAEKLVELVPCAEMVRFGKNGSDATAGAIRLARAFTGRDHVAVCGYHGWQDWYIGSTPRNRGVPAATQSLTHAWSYNDIASLEKLFQALPGDIAAVILEPMNLTEPQTGFLQAVKEVMLSLWPFIEADPRYREQALLERLVEPDRVLQFRVSWVDDRGAARTRPPRSRLPALLHEPPRLLHEPRRLRPL